MIVSTSRLAPDRVAAQADAALAGHRTAGVVIRTGAPEDAPAIVGLIEENREVGHLLPRTIDEVTARAHRFAIVVSGDEVIGCAELAPLSQAVAEVRSLVVGAPWRGLGLGTRVIATLQRQARLAGFSTLCALTHDPGPFVRLGFSIVPHVWFPEKIAVDCTSCAKFRACGQFAMALPLDRASLSPSAATHRRLPVTMATPVPPGAAGGSAVRTAVDR
jgi:amino-acid N-acetyltransferase